MEAEDNFVDYETGSREASIKLDTNARRIDCTIVNVSDQGAKVRLHDDRKLPRRFSLLVPTVGDEHEDKPVELKWQIGTAVSVRFRSESKTHQN